MGFQQGLSGLNAASKSLDTIGNNVANANTVGFKQSETIFADVYAASITGASATETGIGTKVVNVSQQFTQGNITSSNNPLDIAINGNGFFRMSDQGTIVYSRNGQFHLDKDGYIVNSNGLHLTGYAVDSNGVLQTGAATDLVLKTDDIAPKSTSKITEVMTLDARKSAIDPAGPNGTFNMSNPLTYNDSSSVTVYDDKGISHITQLFYVKRTPLPASPAGTQSTWEVYAAVDGTVLPAPAGGKIGTLKFLSNGTLDPTTTNPITGIALPVTTGATTPIGGATGITLDFAGTKEYGSNFSVNTQTQDGFASGHLSGFTVGADGSIVGRYTNGKSATLGQVVLASFKNPNGLQPLGNNVWAETASSGASLVGGPSSGPLGVLQSSAVEDSNVDLTAELVNMITAQRVYQANAQTIKTQDQVLQTLVNLR